MVRLLNVEGYAATKKAIDESLKTSLHVYAYFSGSKDASGLSWCPDCVAAEDVVLDGLKNAPDNSIFIHSCVGDRSYWKDPKNEFRTDADIKLTSIPTLIKCNSTKKLQEDQCCQPDLVVMIFED